MKQVINDFINSLDTKLYSRIRKSEGDAECRRYLKEHLDKQLNTQVVVGQSEQLNCPFCGSLNFQQITKSTDKCMDCQKCWEV